MAQHPLQQWIGRHFLTIVPPLALVGILGGVLGGTLSNSIGWQVFAAGCGSLGCYLWAIHLRKPTPGKWLFLGLIPALPELYLLGWHRAAKAASHGKSPLQDCPRCGAYLAGASHCANCQWQAMEVPE